MLAIVTVLCAALTAPSQGAHHPVPAAAPPSLTGTWNMSLQGDHVIPVGLVLQQEGTKVTGTMMIMQTDVALEGTLVDGTLSMTSNAAFVMGQHGGSGTNPDATAAKMTMTGTVKEDGTLAGELTTSRGALPFTAERLRERPAATPAAMKSAPSSLTGAWKMTVQEAGMAFDLEFQQDGTKVTGAVTSDHSGRLPFEGRFADGTLTFSTDQGTAPAAMHLDYSATVTEQGTLTGQLTGPMGRMTWIGERVKK